MKPNPTPLGLIALLLAGGTLSAARPQTPARMADDARATLLEQARPEEGIAHLRARRSELQLNLDNDFKDLGTQADLEGTLYHRVGQTYRGVPVYGAEAVLRQRPGRTRELHTDRLLRDIGMDVTPSIGLSEIRATARDLFRPFGPNHVPGKVELIIYPVRVQSLRPGAPHRPLGPNAEDFEMRVETYRLAYFVRNTELNHPDGPRQMVHILDAHTGQVLESWNDLHTQAAKGTGKSQYSGTVTLDTTRNASGQYEMRDGTRGSVAHPWTKLVGNQTNNLNNKGKVDPNTGNYSEDPGLGTLYADADNTWGDGTNYVEGSDTNAPQGQTGGVDTHYGVAMTWDMYKNVFGRNGIDGKGTSALNRVHFAHGDTVSEANAFWIGYDATDPQACFCMTYGDGANDWLYGINFKEMTALDVAGHELSHGVCETTANLAYSKDAGGLNEANSDIFGTMVEFYVRGAGGTGTALPDTGGNWLLGNELDANNKPLRWMYKPSKDGKSFDYWKPEFNTGSGTTYDPHFTSGPMNRCFYFMSQGASNSSSSDYYSTYLPSGMTGLGNQKAGQIWYRALLKLTTNATYLDARNAAIAAAKELHGAGGPEEAAVWNAFGGINVGSVWSGPAALSASITSPSANATVATNTAVSFSGNAAGGTSPYTYSWTFGDGGSATGATASHTFVNSGTANITYTVTFTATDTSGATASATRAVTVTPAGTIAVSVTPSSVSLAPGATQQFTASVSGTTNTAVTWTATGGTVTSTGLFTAPATAGTYTVKATSAADATKSASATVTVATTSSDLMKNGGFESGTSPWAGTTADIGAWQNQSAHGGTRCAWLMGNGTYTTESLAQDVAIPSTAASASLTFWMHIDTAETTTLYAYDTLKVQVLNTAGTVLKTLATYSNLNQAAGYVQKSFDLSAFKGQTVRIRFYGNEDFSKQTSFVIDDVSLLVK